MPYLVDTSVLVRLVNLSDTQRPIAVAALHELHRVGEDLLIAPQNLIELWNVATRPTEANGLGASIPETAAVVRQLMIEFKLAEENELVFTALLRLLDEVNVIGKQIHDARLVAVCHVHRIPRILTFNTRHFARFASVDPKLEAVDPASIHRTPE